MTSDNFKFEDALKELEAITAWFERPDIDLDEGLVKFERGMELTSQLKAHLEAVENRVDKINQKFEAKSSSAAPTEVVDLAQSETPDLFN